MSHRPLCPTKHPALQILRAHTTTDNAAAIATADVVVLAIKPQMAATVVPGLGATWKKSTVLVSILAGTTTAKLEALLPAGAHVVRAMPNTPLAIGQGMVGLVRGRTPLRLIWPPLKLARAVHRGVPAADEA